MFLFPLSNNVISRSKVIENSVYGSAIQSVWVHWRYFRGDIGDVLGYIKECPSNRGTRNVILIWRINDENYSIWKKKDFEEILSI